MENKDFVQFGCIRCSSPHVRERGERLYCVSCGCVFEAKNETAEQRDRRIKYLSRLDDAEMQLRMSPPRFDDAEDQYRDFIRQYPKNSDGYWGIVRAKYGIKYEIDINGKEVACCYKSSYEDFRKDTDYLTAIRLAESDTLRKKYEREAKIIAEVCKEWREQTKNISYDVFISFKETDDATGKETPDLREMEKLYSYLVEEGYKVFFSPVSMKRYTGQHYDAYIHNAIQNARVMIIYGSSPEYFSSTWVQNEWTRYMRLLQRCQKKRGSLIVAYDGFTPYELPRPLREIQALDASKENRSFYRDITKCIDQILREDIPEAIEEKPIKKAKPEPKASTEKAKNEKPKADVFVTDERKIRDYSFDESDIFNSKSVSLRRFMVYGERGGLDEIFSDAQALFASVGGPLNVLFTNTVDSKSQKMPATNLSIEDDGVCGNVSGHKLCAGSVEYMNRVGIKVSDTVISPEERSFKTAKNYITMLLAKDGEIVAKFYISYRIPDEFLILLSVLSHFGITPTVYLRDPNIPYEFIEIFTNGRHKYNVNVVKTTEVLSHGAFIKKDFSADKNKIFNMIYELAEEGDAKAIYALGLCYNNGTGDRYDEKQAIKLFKVAARKGNADAMFELGYKQKIKSEKLHKLIAIMYFRKASKHGSAGASYYLGNMYNNGEGVRKNPSKAKKWYKKAADHGYGPALEIIKEMQAAGV